MNLCDRSCLFAGHKEPQPATTGMATSDDELDAILNDLADNTNTSTTQTQAELQRSAVSNNADAGLGIDEEIVITKRRIPAPKLDDQRLRSDAGIPRLQRISKERLRFKGKGHEVSRCIVLGFRSC